MKLQKGQTMARLKTRQEDYTKERYYIDPASGINYRRTTAGLCWPENGMDGAAIVLGETRSRQCFHGNRRHDVHVLEEVRTGNVADLLDHMARMTAYYYVARWALPTYDKRFYMIEDINDILKETRQPIINVGDPQGLEGKGEGQVKFYHALVQARTLNEKTLFLHGATASDEIRQMDDRQEGGKADGDRKPSDFPGAAALFFALAEIDMVRLPEAWERDEYDFSAADNLGGY